jgi:hypothetical protein
MKRGVPVEAVLGPLLMRRLHMGQQGASIVGPDGWGCAWRETERDGAR